jgi:hypothetical protein
MIVRWEGIAVGGRGSGGDPGDGCGASIGTTATFEPIIHTPQTIPRVLLGSRLGASLSSGRVQV